MARTLPHTVSRTLHRTLCHRALCTVTGVREAPDGVFASPRDHSMAEGRSLDFPPLGSRGSGLAPLNQGFAATRLPDLRPGARASANRLHQSLRPPSRRAARFACGRARRLRRREPPFHRHRSPTFHAFASQSREKSEPLRCRLRSLLPVGKSDLVLAFGSDETGVLAVEDPREKHARASRARPAFACTYRACSYRSRWAPSVQIRSTCGAQRKRPTRKRGVTFAAHLSGREFGLGDGGLRPGSFRLRRPSMAATNGTSGPLCSRRRRGTGRCVPCSFSGFPLSQFPAFRTFPASRQSAPAPMERAAGGLPEPKAKPIKDEGRASHGDALRATALLGSPARVEHAKPRAFSRGQSRASPPARAERAGGGYAALETLFPIPPRRIPYL